MATSSDIVLYEKRDRIAWITINRPEAMNALNPDVGAGLADAFEEVANDLKLRASLGDRVAERMRVEMPEAWTCADSIPAAGPAPCPSARTPATSTLPRHLPR